MLLRAIRNRDIGAWVGWRVLEDDHEAQVFVGALMCMGCAWLASWVGVSAPIGSFAAGLWLGRAKGFHWLGSVLKPFKVFFVAFYFVSVGLLLDVGYISRHGWTILGVTGAILLMNSGLSALVFRLLGMGWRDSLSAGAMLSQTGELGLLACSMAAVSGMIDQDVYKLCVAVTGLALLLSTAWASALTKVFR
jgi:CPA2 family monovalent cation:H+ antiporter-2